MGDIFTDANTDRCYDCGKKYNVNWPHVCPAGKNTPPSPAPVPETVSLKRARELVRACRVEYEYQCKEYAKVKQLMDKALYELAAAEARLTAMVNKDDTPDSSNT